MATVRIYKVAELLNTTSQEVTALLKRDHGIEVRSASSTIEEVVGRQFVERLAKQRNIQLPSGAHVRRNAGGQGQERQRAGEKVGRADQAGGADAAATASGQGRQAAAAPALEPELDAEARTGAERVEPAAVEAGRLSRRRSVRR